MYAAGVHSDASIAHELGLSEFHIEELLQNPLYAGRVVRHKGKPTEEERAANFAAPVDPALFARVQELRAERRTRHVAGGGGFTRPRLSAGAPPALRAMRQPLPRRRLQRHPAHPPRRATGLWRQPDSSRRRHRGAGSGTARYGPPHGRRHRCSAVADPHFDRLSPPTIALEATSGALSCRRTWRRF